MPGAGLVPILAERLPAQDIAVSAGIALAGLQVHDHPGVVRFGLLQVRGKQAAQPNTPFQPPPALTPAASV
jgi:hypothetical protein